MPNALTVSYLYAGVGLLFLVGGIPFALERVKPNPYSGFRTQKTLSNAAIWYEANRIMGRDLILAGAVIIAAALIYYRLKNRNPEFPLVAAIFFTFVLSMASVAVHCYWRLSRM